MMDPMVEEIAPIDRRCWFSLVLYAHQNAHILSSSTLCSIGTFHGTVSRKQRYSYLLRRFCQEATVFVLFESTVYSFERKVRVFEKYGTSELGMLLYIFAKHSTVM